MAKERTLTQVEKFKQAARDLETDDDEKRFDEKLGKIARQKPGGALRSDEPERKPGLEGKKPKD